jgi:iron complex transport system ATP-binding protein
MLKVKDLDIRRGRQTLAAQLNFTLSPGQVNVIIGPNGTGKSTLLKAIFGDIRFQSGDLSYLNTYYHPKMLSRWRRLFGYMPQDIRLDVGLSAIEIVLLGKLDSLSLRIDDNLMHEGLALLEGIGLIDLANRDARTLSGGQRQMILFAQALIRCPEILMLDEPVSALDLHFQHVLLEHLVQRTVAQQCVTLMVLHDLNLAVQYADHLLVLKAGQIMAQGSPLEILTPELIYQVYGVNAMVLYDQQGTPFVRTLRA